jgi:hypothetical protein
MDEHTRARRDKATPPGVNPGGRPPRGRAGTSHDAALRVIRTAEPWQPAGSTL